MNKKVAIVISFIILLNTIAVMAWATDPLKLIVNSQEIKSDVVPQLINGRTMVPIRWVAEALGADVNWDGEAVYITGSLAPTAGSVSKQEVAAWIKDQGKDNENSYYIEGPMS